MSRPIQPGDITKGPLGQQLDDAEAQAATIPAARPIGYKAVGDPVELYRRGLGPNPMAANRPRPAKNRQVAPATRDCNECHTRHDEHQCYRCFGWCIAKRGTTDGGAELECQKCKVIIGIAEPPKVTVP